MKTWVKKRRLVKVSTKTQNMQDPVVLILNLRYIAARNRKLTSAHFSSCQLVTYDGKTFFNFQTFSGTSSSGGL